MEWSLKSDKEIETMREGGRLLASVLEALRKETKVGVETMWLDTVSKKLIHEGGAQPAFLGYLPAGGKRPYPFTLCVSVNDCVVHGIPSDYAIRNGDLVKLDLGLKYKGWFVDSAITVGIGVIDARSKRLMETTKTALRLGIEEAQTGRTLGDIGAAVEEAVRHGGFTIVRSLTGHGIGRELHEEPTVLNFGKRGEGRVLKPGTVLAIEPMTAMGSGTVKQFEDDSYRTSDGSLAAHFEHTVAITSEGPMILTSL